MPTTHKPMSEEELKSLAQALRRNGESQEALHMGQDTSFVAHPPEDNEVVSAIRSIPCHY